MTAMDLAALDSTLDELGQPGFRARQVWRWAAGGAPGYEAMTDVPAALRAQLAERVPFSTLELVNEAHSRDGTIKALFRTADGRPVEAVLMRYRDGRRSICVSSQSGCPLTCTFCATGTMKFGRNLTSSEILDQVLHFRRIEPVDHLVFMGMGEPRLQHAERARGARGGCPTSASPTGARRSPRSAGCRASSELAASDLPIRLALSLHAPEDGAALADHAGQRPLPDRRHPRRDRALLRAAPPDGLHRVRDARRRQRHARAGACSSRQLLDPRKYKVNLIPYNPTGFYDGSSRGAIAAFKAVLEEHGLRATVRLTRGRDIDAACGQLAAAALSAAG